MRVVEEPFLTRDLILAILRPAEITTDQPFRTLRQNRAASKGLAVHLRVGGGRMAGQLTLYSSLNADAARAYRMRDIESARKLAARAMKLERTHWAEVIRGAISTLSERMPLDPFTDSAPASLRHFCEACRHASPRGLDHAGLIRSWLVQSCSWLSEEAGDRDELIDAVQSLAGEAERARAEILTDENPAATTFFGIVQRMDISVAEIENEKGEARLVERDDLDRRGLAMLGRPVALLHEALPSGASITLAMSAAMLEAPSIDEPPSPYGGSLGDEGGIVLTGLSKADSGWVERELGRAPTVLPIGPLKVR